MKKKKEIRDLQQALVEAEAEKSNANRNRRRANWVAGVAFLLAIAAVVSYGIAEKARKMADSQKLVAEAEKTRSDSLADVAIMSVERMKLANAESNRYAAQTERALKESKLSQQETEHARINVEKSAKAG